MLDVQSNASYNVITTSKGSWLHAPGSDFIFAYVDKSWSASTKKAVGKAFMTALSVSTKIKTAVLNTSGKKVLDGLYLQDQSAMTKAMNSIKGMGMSAANSEHNSGTGTAVHINKEFFESILAGVGGDIAPLMTYLAKEMGNFQARLKKSNHNGDFGTVIGFVGWMSSLNKPVTSFQYAVSSSSNKSWVTHLACGSAKHHSYSYKYTVVKYNYAPPVGTSPSSTDLHLSSLIDAHKDLTESHRSLIGLLNCPELEMPEVQDSSDDMVCSSEGVILDPSNHDSGEDAAEIGSAWLTGSVTVRCALTTAFLYIVASGVRFDITSHSRPDGTTTVYFRYDGDKSRQAVNDLLDRGKSLKFTNTKP